MNLKQQQKYFFSLPLYLYTLKITHEIKKRNEDWIIDEQMWSILIDGKKYTKRNKN
jgi:hypothetical protein